MKRCFFYLMCMLGFLPNLLAQSEKDSLAFNLHFKWNSEDLTMDKRFVSQKDTLQLDVVKLYLSAIEIQFQDGTIIKDKTIYHLIDIENKASHKIVVGSNENKLISKVSFNIGVDSLASVSGAMSGDLDPVKGMYWAWQSGYINLKIEGKSNSSKLRRNQFQFHLGGYLAPNNSLRKVTLYPNKEVIDVLVDLSKFFNDVDLSKINSVMIPGKTAMNLSDIGAKMFYLE